jgi:hypothetical protein
MATVTGSARSTAGPGDLGRPVADDLRRGPPAHSARSRDYRGCEGFTGSIRAGRSAWWTADLMWKTGHSLIKSKMKEIGAPLAWRDERPRLFAHEYYGFDDALYAAIRLIAASARLGKSVTELRGEMPALVNTPELRFQVDESRKFAVIETKSVIGFRQLARMSMPRMACAFPPPTAGGCCAHRTPRTCSLRAPKAMIRLGWTG